MIKFIKNIFSPIKDDQDLLYKGGVILLTGMVGMIICSVIQHL